MGDPFLAAHHISTGVYSLAGRVPVSIRDQIVRGHYLVDRLFDSKKLVPGSDLAVFGAGAAGATVAILAARRGVKTQLFEAAKSPFRLQRGCKTRWIDPVQYDWPATHAEAGQWPIDGLDPLRVPLGFEAGPASRIASLWASTLNKQRLQKSGNLVALYDAKLTKLPRKLAGAAKIEAHYEHRGVAGLANFDVVILARGIAAERTDVDFVDAAGTQRQFVGPLFWADDDFESPDFGMGAPLQRQFLVSGSGDGALQDYIRLVSGQKSAISLLNSFRGFDGTSAVPGDVRRKIYEAEQEAQRSLVWNTKRAQDHGPLLKLHLVYVQAVEEWKAEGSRWKNVIKSLNQMTANRDVKNLRLYHPCNHFSQSYPLNHLLALVLSRYIFDRFNQQTIKGNTALVSVEAPKSPASMVPTHVCGPTCWKSTHEIAYESGASCASSGGAPTRKVVDGVVIRHGLKQHTSAVLRRHLLPLHLL